MKKKNLLSLIFCLISVYNFSQESDKVIIFPLEGSNEISMFGLDGELLATLPVKHVPKTTQTTNVIESFAFQSHLAYDFANGPLPVKSPEGWYLMNEKGKVIKTFDEKFTRLLPGQGGYMRAFVPHSSRRGFSEIIFLDFNGNPLFNGKRFFKATAFNDGFAVVQEEYKGPWFVLNAKGEMKPVVNEEISKHIYYASEFSDGIANVLLKRPRGYDRNSFVYQTYLIDSNADLVTNLNDKINFTRELNPSKYENGMLYYNTGQGQQFIDTKGYDMGSLQGVGGIQYWGEDYILKDYGGGSGLYDLGFNQVYLPPSDGRVIVPKSVNGNYLMASLVDTINQKSTQGLFEIENFDLVYETEKIIIDYYENCVVVGSKKSDWQTQVTAMEDFNNVPLMEVPAKQRLFVSFEEALPFKEEVQSLRLNQVDDLSQLMNFPNLKNLEIRYSSSTMLPELLGQLSKLKKLSLYKVDNLSVLPKSLVKLDQLESLNISYCPKLTGLESLLPQLKSLKYIYTNDYSYQKGFVEQFKKEHPTIVLNNWMSAGDFEDTIIEEEVSPLRFPPPPPPPPKRKNNY